jgi:hypothetical protein
MLRGVLIATIVAAFPLAAGAAGAVSEDIPIPGGTEALASAAGIRVAPDRARFVSEVTRLIFEAPSRDRTGPVSAAARISAHLFAAARLQRALAGVSKKTLSVADAADGGTRRQLTELLEVVGLRFRERRGAWSVEPTGADDAQQRVRLLDNLGLGASGLGVTLNNGGVVTLAMPVDMVPVPLSSAVWSEVILRRKVPPAELFAAILADDRAALLCHGLAGLDDPTLEYLSERPDLLRAIYEQAAVFSAFGSRLRIREGRVVTPGEAGADAARTVWENLVEAKAADPARFIPSLLGRRAGRLAYVYDTIGELDQPRIAFALGLWIKDPELRIARARAVVEAVSGSYPEWPTPQRPFVRPLHDLGALLNAVSVLEDGSPRPPALRLLWRRAFEGPNLPDDPAGELREEEPGGTIDAAWLARNIAMLDVRMRAQRLMQLAFGHRVFGDAAPGEAEDILVALRAFTRYRTAMLALEQIGIRRAGVYAATARQAEAIGRLAGGRAFVALSQFQGALAIIVRIARNGSATASEVEGLITSLARVPVNGDHPLAGGIGDWVRRDLLKGEDDAAEHALMAALGGPVRADAPVVEWEGGSYRFDPAAAEFERLRRVRERQGGYTLDTAVQLHSTARSLSVSSIDLEGVARGSAALARLQKQLPRKEEASPSERVPGGAEGLQDPHVIVERAIRDLTRITRPRDARRAAAVAADVLEAADIVLGEVLSSTAYALAIGDPDGPTLLGGDVARRHDFGVSSRIPGFRDLEPWTIPEQHYDPGVPWHVTGSLIGLDVALAPQALQRLAGDTLFGPPVLGSNDRETFARSVALMNPYTLRDAERDRIGQAIQGGRRRAALARSAADLDALADSVRMDGWRRRALHWTAANEPEQTLSLLSMNELFLLGGGDIAEVHGWGTAMTPLWGCLCSRMPAPNAWRFVTGRPQAGVLGSSVPDVMLHVADRLHELDLPAGLAKSVLAAAMQQFVDTVRPNDGNDWLTLVRGAVTATRERFEDFVAAAAAVGGPLVPINAAAAR